MSVRLFVGNLPYDVTEIELKELFAPVGSLSSVVIPIDRETGKRRGFAFVEFGDKAKAEEASRRFNNQPFKGRSITVNEARARESRNEPGAPMRSGPSAGRPSFGPRPSLGPVDFGADALGGSARSDRRSRNFGPDAKPAHKRKQPHFGSKAEKGAKKRPLRERTGGQFFGSPDDALYEDALEDDNLPESKHWDEDEE
jgi:cold-inducible RNA-binding protein